MNEFTLQRYEELNKFLDDRCQELFLENKKLTENWNMLKMYINDMYKDPLNSLVEDHVILEIVNKIIELENEK